MKYTLLILLVAFNLYAEKKTNYISQKDSTEGIVVYQYEFSKYKSISVMVDYNFGNYCYYWVNQLSCVPSAFKPNSRSNVDIEKEIETRIKREIERIKTNNVYEEY